MITLESSNSVDSGKNWPSDQPAELTLIKTLTVTYQKHRSLILKRNLDNLQKFVAAKFCLPVPKIKLEHEHEHKLKQKSVEKRDTANCRLVHS